MKNSILATAVLSSLLAATPSFAKSGRTGPEGMSDTAFAKQVAQGNMAEVKMGQLAKDKSEDPDVKAFGDKLINDHNKANDQLKQIASAQNIQLPSDPSKMQDQHYNHLSQLTGKRFDRVFASQMVSDHEKDIAAFNHEAKAGKNDDIKNFAQSTLPTLEDHLRTAEDLQKKFGGSKGAAHTKNGMRGMNRFKNSHASLGRQQA